MPENPAVSRRLLLGGALATGAVAVGAGTAQAKPADSGTALPAPAPRRGRGQKSMIGVPYDVHEAVRVGVIGIGNRGSGMGEGWAAVPGCRVTAVCDIRENRAKGLADRLVAQGEPRPAEYGGSAKAYAQMLKRDDIDLVYIATPWQFHYRQGRDALLAGKHVVVELPIATELDELWELVDVSERTRRHLMLAENCSYGRNELAMLRMAHQGLFGDITNGHGGYLHDLREMLFSDTYYTDAWRRLWHTRSTASFYAMHGLAPIAAAMDINRGDRMTVLRATATEPKALADYRERFVSRSHPSWKETYVNGDLVTCLIDTAKGRVIRAEHDVSSPRPYSRINSLAGSRGIFEDYAGTSTTGGRIYVEPDHSGHAWRDFDTYRKEFDHWLWRKIGDDAENNGGHGGMDYVMQWRTVQLMRAGLVPDIDVYDSASWCSPVPLSVASLAAGGRPVQVPDFTRGSWMNPRPGLDSRETDMPPVA
ncbi:MULTISPECIES: Gfo/Idh/MocA family protein [Streptomyces]|uniref:Glycosyl hydrolase family 109 protein n=2 Tax=Streptomyces TaxID=1883 RepID=A0A380P9G3_STRGR|nr:MULTISPECIES: Gfo/Idh/MocA family oxidoreductase [Streptomyces]NEE36468.1 Gfo/Idh/MocA family oxidoreductase [Streptomyces sp. SID7982]NEE52205.1 Gfo/Idh/MocA family oxidoreductase [Streptomyces sp. SID8455]WSU39308.1 Gfo/Idh/MocA family oxidoreductase [Streptomyces gougerotii]MBL3808308.1 Gfo/Idh/MocA family oxidoreductase [Streptomyces sp. BRB081]PJM81633.1 glycosyl hydrolase [Streptomyces sp. TSRI0384-2]